MFDEIFIDINIFIIKQFNQSLSKKRTHKDKSSSLVIF